MRKFDKLWARSVRGLLLAAVVLMLINGFHKAGNGDPESVVRGMLGMAVVGVPSLLSIWLLDILIRRIVSAKKNSGGTEG
jgi:hypothetical protein